MKVKLRTTYAGPGGVYAAGAEVELPDKEAKALLSAGFALPVKSMPREQATLKLPETSTK